MNQRNIFFFLRSVSNTHTVIQDTRSAEISQKQDRHNIHVIMKTMCPPGYHHNSFVASHAFGHRIYGYTLLVPMNQRVLKS